MLSLFSSIKLIYSVSLQSQKFSEMGYCVSTLEMCLECIMGEVPFNEDEDNVE